MASALDTVDWKIEEGDRVSVYFVGDFQGSVYGTVRHKAQATGECWVIESDFAIHYVQNFMQIKKDKAR